MGFGVRLSASALMAATACPSCLSDGITHQPYPLQRVHTDRNYLRDGYGRYVSVHGVNVAGSSKVPTAVRPPNDVPSCVGAPFPLEVADRELGRIAALGFNVIRLVVTWEAIEPTGPGEYDQEYLAYLGAILRAGRER